MLSLASLQLPALPTTFLFSVLRASALPPRAPLLPSGQVPLLLGPSLMGPPAAQPGAGGQGAVGSRAEAAAHEDALGRDLPWSRWWTLPCLISCHPSRPLRALPLVWEMRAEGAELVTTLQPGELPWEQGWVWRKGFSQPWSDILSAARAKALCAGLCVPSPPLSPVPRTPGFWAEPVHWVSSLVWGSGVGMVKARVPALSPVACLLLVVVAQHWW